MIQLLDKALAYAERGQHRTAHPFWEAAAAEGHPVAQYRLAMNYDCARGMNYPDPERAQHWFKCSARQGYTPAQYELANYYYARGSRQKAFTLYKRAAYKGHPAATNAFGYYFREKDLEIAKLWQDKSFQLGYEPQPHALILK